MTDDENEMTDDNYHRRGDTPLDKCQLPRWCQPRQPPAPPGTWLLERIKPRGNAL